MLDISGYEVLIVPDIRFGRTPKSDERIVIYSMSSSALLEQHALWLQAKAHL